MKPVLSHETNKWTIQASSSKLYPANVKYFPANIKPDTSEKVQPSEQQDFSKTIKISKLP